MLIDNHDPRTVSFLFYQPPTSSYQLRNTIYCHSLVDMPPEPNIGAFEEGETMEHYFDLGLAYHQRYESTHQLNELESAIMYYESGLKTGPTSHSGDLLELHLLNNLGLALSLQCQQLGDLKDLEKAIACHEQVMTLCPVDHPDRTTFLTNFANALQTQFKQVGKMESLRRAIIYHNQALSLCQVGHPGRTALLNGLASALLIRYEQFGRMKDLKKAITCHEQSLNSCLPGEPHRFRFLNSFANALQARYRQFGDIEDLNRAITCQEHALELCPPDHPDKPRPLNNLANALQTRYKKFGQIEDLQRAIACHKEALDLRPPGHPDRYISLSSLASSLHTRYKQFGHIKDLEEAIMWNEQALGLCPSSCPLRSIFLNNLASALQTRYKELGEINDLEKAIMWYGQALALRPPTHPFRSSFLNNLASALKTRYREFGEMKDLERAISCHSHALALCPPGHFLRSMCLNNLANTLWDRFIGIGDIEDLEKAITCHEQALNLCPPGNLGRPISLNNLAEALHTKYKKLGDMKDLEIAITCHRQALDLRLQGHHDRSVSLNNLAGVLKDRYQQIGIIKDMEQAIMCHEQAAFHEQSSLPDRLRAAKFWAINAHKQQLSCTISAYTLALNLQQQHLALLPSLTSQQGLVKKSSRLSLDAASYAIHAGKLETAIEFLEQGRSILWSKIHGYRQSLEDIASKAPQLAEEFQAVSKKLEYNATSTEIDTMVLHHALSDRWRILLEEIRRLDGFQDFLCATPFKILKNASAEGPVIMVNISNFSSDAIILVPNSPPSTISLDNASPQILNLLSNQISRATANSDSSKNAYQVLQYLWYSIVKPIVEQLVLLGVPEKSHIWWCPTSYLCALPIHAAGPYKKGFKNLPDLFISSYTPTLESLIRARSNLPKPQTVPKFLIVSQPDDTIPHVFEEAKVICSFQKQVDVCSGGDANKESVLAALQSHPWVHFACHGHLEDQPFNSWFQLYKGEPLTVLDLARGQLPNAEFAFLSACHSASSNIYGTPDESIHLAAALQFSGFRSVIGTLWAMIDDDGPSVVNAFYKHMFHNSDFVDLRHAAEALNIATKELRNQHTPLERWINFIHIGP